MAIHPGAGLPRSDPSASPAGRRIGTGGSGTTPLHGRRHPAFRRASASTAFATCGRRASPRLGWRQWTSSPAGTCAASSAASSTSGPAASRRHDRAGTRPAGEPVIGNLIDQLVGLEVRFGGAAHELRSGHLVPEVTDDGRIEEVLAVLVPVLPPRVDGAGTERLEDPGHGMKAEDRSVEASALRRRCPWRTNRLHVRVTGPTVDPAVDAELQPVGARVHVAASRGEPVEHHFGGAVRHTIGITVRNEEDVRRRHGPDTAVADGETHQVLELVGEHAPIPKFRAAVRVVEDHDPVQELVREAVAVHRVVLGHPETAVGVPGELDGILDVGLCREDTGLESRRQLHLAPAPARPSWAARPCPRAPYWC